MKFNFKQISIYKVAFISFAASFINIASAQLFAPIKNLQYHQIECSHLPGIFKEQINLEFKTSNSTTITYQIIESKQEITEGKYIAPIKIHQTITIRVIIQQPKIKNDSVYVGTYIIQPHSQLPVLSLHVNYEDFNGENGILSGELEFTNNHYNAVEIKKRNKGRVWKKENTPTYVEYFEPNQYIALGTFRVQPFGGMTLAQREKSLRIFSDSTIGPKSLKFNPFMNKKFNSYKSIVIRTSGNDQNITRMKDMTLSSFARDLNLDYMDYRPSILLINGEYWGIYNLREKINEEYLKYNHGAPKDDRTTLLFFDGGHNKDYKSFIKFVERDFPIESAFDSLNTKMDFENYINYIILQIHIQNIDSRGNVRFWKSKALDNRWRWIFYDSDLSSVSYLSNFNYLNKRLSPKETDWYNSTWSTTILRNIVKYPKLRNFFINEYCFLLGTKLHQDTAKNRVETFASIIRNEIPFHQQRRDNIYNQDAKFWENQITLFKKFFDLRHETSYEHLKSSFNLTGDRIPVSFNTNLKGINTLRLAYTTSLFQKAQADFFTGVPIEIEATNLNFNYVFSHWNIDNSKTPRISIDPKDHQKIEAIYTHRNYSKFENIHCDAIAFRQTKKDTFYAIRIVNNSSNDLNKFKISIHKNGNQQKLDIQIPNFQSSKSYWFTNDTNRIKKINKNDQVIIINELPGFALKGGEWVILDEFQNVIDSIYIAFPDSMLDMHNIIIAKRDIDDGTWNYTNKAKKLKSQKSVIAKAKNYIIWIIFVAAFLFIIFFFIRRKKKNAALVLFFFVINISFSQIDHLGLDSSHVKLINNKGQGYVSLNGLRNVRVVLRNLVYRGGNNRKPSVQNPLTINTLNNLKNQGFDEVIYLYAKNWKANYDSILLDSIKKGGLHYSCKPTLDTHTVYEFMREIYRRANYDTSKGYIYIHCWNGWHQSGWLSAMTLKQFCGFNNQQALKYWETHTDNQFKGYTHVKKGIANYKIDTTLLFTEEQKNTYCPCVKEEIKKPKVNNQLIDNKILIENHIHIVKKNETIYSIAKKYKLSAAKIIALNDLSKKKKLKIGQELLLN